MFYHEIDELWHLNDTLNIKEAAALIAGYEPIYVEWEELEADYFKNENGVTENDGIKRVNVAFLTLLGAVKSEALAADLVIAEDGVCEPETIWSESTIKVADLKAWLQSKGMTKGFFFPEEQNEAPGYMDPDHPLYSNTLSAAVRVWEAMQDPELREGKAVKSAMESWLEANYKDLGLTRKDGGMSRSAIEDVAKIANWNKVGGATKTPDSPSSDS
ncbi:MAG: hypothetical protein CMI12_01635 [Oceanospirillum sp.]|nr:hypothetical protein [Oceanospirillum sp.]